MIMDYGELPCEYR